MYFNIYILKPAEEIGLCSLKPVQLLSKVELIPLFLLCKSAWYASTAAQENVLAKLMTQHKKKSS